MDENNNMFKYGNLPHNMNLCTLSFAGDQIIMAQDFEDMIRKLI